MNMRKSLRLPLALVVLLTMLLGSINPLAVPVAQAAGTWTLTGNMSGVRAGHTMTLLPNGKVLVAGGNVNGSPQYATAELYDPAAGTFSPTGSMASGRAGHTATLLPNGKVLVAGGYDVSNASLASAELYDPAVGTFSLTGSLNAARGLYTATLLPSGKVLVAGGTAAWLTATQMASAELYDPAAGTFSLTGSLNVARREHTATRITNGKVLVAGGSTGQPSGAGTPLASAELYDPAVGTFSPTGSLSVARWGHTSTLIANGKTLIAAGGDSVNFLTSAELYDPNAGTFSSTGSLTFGRNFHTATLLLTGKTLMASGGGPGQAGPAELYDPNSGTFSSTGSLTYGRYRHAATLLPNGCVMVTGGMAISGSGLQGNSAELYAETTCGTSTSNTGPDLAITKVGVVTGQTITYTITVTNIGTVPAANPVQVTDALPTTPAGMVFTSTSTNCTGGAFGPKVCTDPNAPTPLGPSQSFTSTLVLNVGNGGGAVTNCATVSQGSSPAIPADPNLTNNRACATNDVPAATGGGRPDLAITKTGRVDGQTVVYTITVTNIGAGSAAQPVQFSDPLPTSPAGMQFGSFSTNCSGGPAGPIVCTDPNAPTPLGPSQSFTSTIVLNVGAAGGFVVNCATVSQGSSVATPPDPNLANNQACDKNTVPPTSSTTTGSISGHKWNDLNMNGIMDPGEPGMSNILLCLAPTTQCVATNSNGDYAFPSVPSGNYSVFEAFYPDWVSTTPGSRPVTVIAGQALTGVNFGNGAVAPPPTEVTVGGSVGTWNGVPTVFYGTPVTITKDVIGHCGGVAPVQVRLVLGIPVTQGSLSQMMTHTSGSVWSATFPLLSPHHGIATLTFYVDCPPDTAGFPDNLTDADSSGLPDTMGPEDEIQHGGMIYIDPSGTVVNDATSAPIAGATVTLLKETPAGSGTYVMPAASDAIPSTNPQTTGASGAYGWMVVPGRWKVRSAAPGCTTVDSAAMDIPPAVTELTLRLTCQSGSGGGPVLIGPADKSVQSLGPLLQWTNPAGTTQYQIQVIPSRNDGPGINLIRNADSSGYQVMAPVLGAGNYVMLPGMSYTWRVRTTQATTAVEENDPSWGPWSSRNFMTAPPSSAGVRVVSPATGGRVESLTPVLTWDNTAREVFYYEVQVSKDPAFNTDPQTATASVYMNLIHGGQSTPQDSYAIPTAFPLEPATTYSWHVRPRVQGDGTPVAWSTTWTFRTP